MSLDYGGLISSYTADNGVFKTNKFMSHIREHNQKLSYCGVNANDKNGAAERAIQKVSEYARAIILYAACHWDQEVTSELWSTAVDYVMYLYNNLLNEQEISSADLFSEFTMPRYTLRDCHIWGCSVYVLDLALAAGKKLPRWQPCSRRGIFLESSPVHSSDLPLILNLRIGKISPQYHVVFDNNFTTVCSRPEYTNPPWWWNVVDLEENILRLLLDEDTPTL